MQRNASLILLALAFSVCVWIWAAVGTIRSASRHVTRGGSAVAATVVQGLIALSCLSGVIGSASPQGLSALSEMVRLARNDDSLEVVSTTLMPDGRTLLLEGSLGQGSALHVRGELRKHPQVRTLRLHSPGGRLFEARAIARAVKRQSLDTLVHGSCESACTMILLAGARRSVTEVGRVGFHRPSFGGADASIASAASMTDSYREAGLSEEFIERVTEVPSNTMWYPTREELLEDRVITHVISSAVLATGSAHTQSSEALGIKARQDPVRRTEEAAQRPG